jgi:hypothetical protein
MTKRREVSKAEHKAWKRVALALKLALVVQKRERAGRRDKRPGGGRG